MSYNFKALQEIGWSVVVAIVVFVGQYMTDNPPDTVTDWKVWILPLLGGIARLVFGLVTAAISGSRIETK